MLKQIFISRKRKKVADLYKTVFSTDNGKKVLHDLMQRCYVTSTTFDDHADKNGQLEIARREGKREVALFIVEQLGLSEADVVTISTESLIEKLNPEGEEAYG